MLTQEHSKTEAGFVLPYVLVVVAILSAISILGVNTIRERTADLSVLIENQRVERALDDAEEIVTFSFLTRPMTTQGLDLSDRYIDPRTIAPDLFPDESEIPPDAIWRAEGDARRLFIRGVEVDVFYRDIAGLISINSASSSVLESWLSTYLEQPSLAKSLTAKLLDYRDQDNRRVFLGGERADYKFRTLRPPTNSSLRSFAELSHVLDWDLSQNELSILIRHFSILPMAERPVLSRAPSVLSRVLREETETVFSRGSLDLVDAAILNSRLPTENARFIFFANGAGSAPSLQRIVEFERTTGAPNLPRQRRTVADGVALVNKQEYIPDDEIRQFPVPGSSNDR